MLLRNNSDEFTNVMTAHFRNHTPHLRKGFKAVSCLEHPCRKELSVLRGISGNE